MSDTVLSFLEVRAIESRQVRQLGCVRSCIEKVREFENADVNIVGPTKYRLWQR